MPPRIVLERLRANAPAVNHPDADLLTAFSERSLPEAERGIVLEHLALCADCRDILALAVPEKDHEREVVEGSAVGGWFTWSALRWGFVTAGLLVAGFGVLQYQKRARPSAVALNDQAPSLAASEPRNEPQPSPAIPAAAKEQEKSSVSRESAALKAFDSGTANGAPPQQTAQLIAPPVTLPKSSGVVGGPLPQTLAHGPLLNQNQSNQANLVNRVNPFNQAAQQGAATATVSANVPQAAAGGEIHGAAAPAAAPAQVAPVMVEAQAVSGRDVSQLQPLQNQRTDQQSLDGGSAESKVERVKPLDGISVSSTQKVLRALPRRAEGAQVGGMAVASWNISSAGGLQRSFDQGHSWQNVNVNVSPAMDASPSYAANVRKQSTAKSDGQPDENSDDKDEGGKKKSAPPTVFRAVAANGADVWAGGSAGLLYHSIDSGGHWTTVVPFAADHVLTGDIVSVEFADTQHGKVATSTSEIWLTADGGKTWLKQ
ncbi:MAG: YCF48-related protein [Candidatus Sulfotelmatobacter sp.]